MGEAWKRIDRWLDANAGLLVSYIGVIVFFIILCWSLQ